MTVVHIFKDFYPPTTGGVEQHMHVLCSALAKTIRTVVLVPSRSRKTIEESIDGIHVIRAAEFGRYASAPLCPTLPLWLRRLRPDLVHLHYPNPMGDLTVLLSGVRAPLVLTYHSDIIKQRAYLPFYRPVIQRIFRRAAAIIVTSREYATSSEQLRGFLHRTTTIPLGIDPVQLTKIAGDDEEVARVRAEFPRGLVLFVGALRYYKGIDVLLRAMCSVDAHLLIVGRGANADLSQMATDLGIRDRIAFAGEVSSARLRVLFHAADVLALPSIDRCEAFGIVQLEAMACGKPVVSTDLPTGVPYVNQHEVTGLVVPPGDPPALAAALNRLLRDPSLRARLGQAGRQRVLGEFTVTRMVERVLDVYNGVLEGSAHASVSPAAEPQADRLHGVVR